MKLDTEHLTASTPRECDRCGPGGIAQGAHYRRVLALTDAPRGGIERSYCDPCWPTVAGAVRAALDTEVRP